MLTQVNCQELFLVFSTSLKILNKKPVLQTAFITKFIMQSPKDRSVKPPQILYIKSFRLFYILKRGLQNCYFTVTSHRYSFPYIIAVTIAFPSPFAYRFPTLSTVTTFLLLDFHFPAVKPEGKFCTNTKMYAVGCEGKFCQ